MCMKDPFSVLGNLAGTNEDLSPSPWRTPQAMKQDFFPLLEVTSASLP